MNPPAHTIMPDALLNRKDRRRATEARVTLPAAVFHRRNRDLLCPVWPWAGERPLPSWLFVSALALLGFAGSGTRWSADGHSGLAHPRPSVLCRRSVAGTLTPAATAVWPRTNAAGHFPFPVRGRARSRRPWWRCPHWTERLPAAGLAWAMQSSPPRLGLISRLAGWENWLVLCL